MKKIYVDKFRRFGSEVTVLEIDPDEFQVQLCRGDVKKRQPVPDIKHNWFEEHGYTKVAAINASFFSWSIKPTPVQLSYEDAYAVHTPASDNGFPECVYYADGTMKIEEMTADEFEKYYREGALFAFSMSNRLIVKGVINKDWWKYIPKNLKGRHPRSLFAKRLDGTLLFVTVDGRSKESKGCTMEQCAMILEEIGAYTGGNMDGGGSTTMSFRNSKSDDERVINTPSGSLRAVANALVVYSKEDWMPQTSMFTHYFNESNVIVKPEGLRVRSGNFIASYNKVGVVNKNDVLTSYMKAPNGWHLIDHIKDHWCSGYYLDNYKGEIPEEPVEEKETLKTYTDKLLGKEFTKEDQKMIFKLKDE